MKFPTAGRRLLFTATIRCFAAALPAPAQPPPPVQVQGQPLIATPSASSYVTDPAGTVVDAFAANTSGVDICQAMSSTVLFRK